MDKETLSIAINKINSHISETEKTIVGMQGLLVGLNKSKAELVSLLRAAEEDEKNKNKKVKSNATN